MKLRLLCAAPVAALLTLALGTTSAATLERDLGQGLPYLRVTDLATDLPAIEAALAARPALVLDLRHATASAETALALSASLARPSPAAHTARLLLISGATSHEVVSALSPALSTVVTLSAATPALTPDIAVATPTEEDRRAYDALTAGTPVDKLLNGSVPQKARYDEASLVRDHANGTPRASFGPDEDDDPEPSETAPPTPPATPPVDRVLLRAVQLHRALLALRKL